MATITIAIAGITGTLGRLITKHLLSHPDVHINGLYRNPSKLPLSLQTDPRLTLFQANASDVKVIRRALRKADVAICCYLGDATTVMVDGQKTLIDACIDEGVRRYIASDWSMDFRKLALGEHPPKDPMKHVQAYLEEKSDEITAVHVLNACFLERPWVGLWDAQKECFRYWGTGDEKWEFTSYNNAAEYTAEVALDREANGWLSCKLGPLDQLKQYLSMSVTGEKKAPNLSVQFAATTSVSETSQPTSRLCTTANLSSSDSAAWTIFSSLCIRPETAIRATLARG